MKEAVLKKYARLLVEVGVALQKGQKLVVRGPVERADFLRLCVEAGYDAGASEVIVSWRDDFVTRQKYLRADAEVFDSVPAWEVHFLTDYAKADTPVLSLTGADPEALQGVDPVRLLANAKASAEQLKEYRRLQMTDFFRWCVAGVATEKWAEKVFPNAADPVEALWEAILSVSMVDEESDPVALWREKQRVFEHRTQHMNERHYKALHYRNSLGTDLVVGLPAGHIWAGGSSGGGDRPLFLPNIPTEEIFTAPSRTEVNGVVCAALPLVLNGGVVEGLRFTVKDGYITGAEAEKGRELLLASLNSDPGARRFGEVALVPYDSPISNRKTLFYNTLYDENASCHFAFGAAYPETIQGGSEMSEEAFEAAGGNNSGTHVDFMVGTADLSIDGILPDGTVEPVFVDGNFAF